MVVVPNVGHMVHEVSQLLHHHCQVVVTRKQDDPIRLAEILVEFWKRNDRVGVGVKKVKKVGEL